MSEVRPRFWLELSAGSFEGSPVFVTRGNASAGPYRSCVRSYTSYSACRSELADAGVRLSILEIRHLIDNRRVHMDTDRRTLWRMGLLEAASTMAV